MDSKKFTHSGKVISTTPESVVVAVESQGACGGCQARSKCGMVDSATREIVVELSKGESYNIGDEVRVAISYHMGIISVLYAYIIPLFVLIGALVGSLLLNLNEGVAALISLGVVAIYYVLVYYFRNKLDKQIKFTIEN